MQVSPEETETETVGAAADAALDAAPLIPPQSASQSSLQNSLQSSLQSSPGSHIQSDEELLAQDAPAERTPLAGRFGALSRWSAPRTGRALQAVAAAVALILVAAVSGSLAHSMDRHSAAADADRRVLVRLVGAGPELTLRDGGQTTGALSVGVQLQMTVRNDGSRAEQIMAADLQQPGVVLNTPVAQLTIRPGESQAIGLHLTVSCNRVDLPQYPDAVTLDLRDPDGRVTHQVFAFGGRPAPASAAPGGDSGYAFLSIAPPGSSYFAMCAEGIQETGAPSTFLGMVGAATAADPTIRYRMRVETGNQWARILTSSPDPRAMTPLGLTVQTDLTAPVEVAPGTPHVVTVTEHITDCAVAAHAISDLGLVSYVVQAREGAGLSIKAADPRFQSLGPQPLDVLADASGLPDFDAASGFTTLFIEQLAVACPTLG